MIQYVVSSHEEIREAYLWSKQTRNVSQGDTVNGALASRGWNYQALGNARDAWCLVNRHYSSHCNDKCTGEFSNKVHQILYKLCLLTLHF